MFGLNEALFESVLPYRLPDLCQESHSPEGIHQVRSLSEMAGKDASRKANITRVNLAKDSTHDAPGAAVGHWRFCDTHWHDIESMLNLSLANLD